MEQNQYFIGNDLYAKQKELLEEERQNLIEAYDESYGARFSSNSNIAFRKGEQYFNENYEQ
jgi:hypothetical protein